MDHTKKKGHRFGMGIAIGLPLGMPIGLALGSIAYGPLVGALLGVVIGAALEKWLPVESSGNASPLSKKGLLLFLGLGVVVFGGVIVYVARL